MQIPKRDLKNSVRSVQSSGKARSSAKTLRRREQDYHKILSLLPAAVYTCDAQGRITYFNRRAADLWGREPAIGDGDEPFCGSFRLWLPDGSPLPHHQTPMVLALKKGVPCRDCEVVIEQPNGSRLTVNVNIDPLFDDDGAIRGAVNVFQDITHRKRAEKSLSESEERFRLLADNISQLAWTCDELGSVTWYNKRWYDYTGMSVEEMRDWGWTKVHHPDHVEQVVAGVKRAQKSGEVWEDTFPLRGKDGEYRWFLSRAIPIRNGSGTIVSWFGTNTDVTELRETQAKLANANEELFTRAKQLDKLVAARTAELRDALGQMEEFSFSVAHDLRAPLRAMTAYASMLLEDYGDKLDDNGRGCAEKIRRASERMDRLTRDVLTYSRVARGEVNLQCVSLDRLVKEIIHQQANFQPPAAEIEIVGHLPDVLAHEISLNQSVTNLLINAVKFVAPGVKPRVRIWSERIGNQVRVWVEDNGIGIKPEHHSRIFKIFERLNPGPNYEGTGIGLTIVRKALEKMGGKVGLESDGTDGSRFWIELPLASST